MLNELEPIKIAKYVLTRTLNGESKVLLAGENLDFMISEFDRLVAINYSDEENHIILELTNNYEDKLIKTYNSEIDK